MSLRDARGRAGRELVVIRAGEAQREAATVHEGLDRFFDAYAPERIKLGLLSRRTLQTYRNQAKLYVRPDLGKRRVDTMTRRNVERAVRRLPNAMRNRVLALVSRLTERGWTMVERDDESRRGATGDVARERTSRRLLVARLRVRIARLEGEQPSDPRVGKARRELRALIGAVEDTE